MALRGGGLLVHVVVTLAIMFMICIIDYFMGDRVLLFNSWAVLAATLNSLLGTSLAHPGGLFVGSWKLGAAALPLGWLLFIAGPALLSIVAIKIANRFSA